MVTKDQGKRMIADVVKRHRFVKKNSNLIGERHLSEQDIRTNLFYLCLQH
jgi:hypothetical protein